MQHKCRVTVIDKKCFNDLQGKYLADPASGVCPFYNVGDEFVFERYGERDDFWREGNGSQCAEAWDCISRYIYTALQGGSIMRNWTNDERMMIACCNDGTRPVIFRIERIDDWEDRDILSGYLAMQGLTREQWNDFLHERLEPETMPEYFRVYFEAFGEEEFYRKAKGVEREQVF